MEDKTKISDYASKSYEAGNEDWLNANKIDIAKTGNKVLIKSYSLKNFKKFQSEETEELPLFEVIYDNKDYLLKGGKALLNSIRDNTDIEFFKELIGCELTIMKTGDIGKKYFQVCSIERNKWKPEKETSKVKKAELKDEDLDPESEVEEIDIE